VVEAHGGRIELDSPVPNRLDGTRFTVVIPGPFPHRPVETPLAVAPVAGGELA
jgi:signal transduction histidine kinase